MHAQVAHAFTIAHISNTRVADCMQ